MHTGVEDSVSVPDASLISGRHIEYLDVALAHLDRPGCPGLFYVTANDA